MAEVQPLRTLRYEPRAVGSLEDVIAPPYDVIDEQMRGELAVRSPFNVVEIDLPRGNGGDPYMHARDTMDAWRQQGVLVREREPALWVLDQNFTGPDGSRRTRRGFFARVRVEDYGAGRIRPHERTQPGPKEDRLRLTRATRANLSPVFALFADPDGAAEGALRGRTEGPPFAELTDGEGTRHTLWRVADTETIADLQGVLAAEELLIADGHHRYETARVYAEEIGGEGEHRYVLMFLCSLDDPGLAIFPTHRLLTDLDESKRRALKQAIERDFEAVEVAAEVIEPAAASDAVEFGYLDGHDPRPVRLRLRNREIADRALRGKAEPYRRLDTAVLEAVVLRGALGMSEEDIANLRGLAYSKDSAEVRDAVESGRAGAGFLLSPTPLERVREVAEAGESMPPKSTYFYPKVPTGIVFNLLE